MQPKRIILAGPAHPLRGGLAAFNERYARALKQAGHEVIIYTFSLQYPSFLFPGKSQFTTDPAPADLEIHVKINSVNPFNWIRIGRELKKLNADAIICRFWIPFIGPSLGTIAKIARKNECTKIIGFLDNVIPHEHRAGDKLLTSWFLKSCNGFIVMSKQVLEELRSFVADPEYALTPHPLYDYGNPVNRKEACDYLQLDADKKILLFFGFIRGYKGLDLLLEALAIALKQVPDLHLVIAGEFYESETPYLEQIKKNKLKSFITLHQKYIPDAEVKYYFGAADLVVQPYKTATQSGISQLAYHFEKPMVVTNVGGLPEIVPDREAGYVVQVDPKEIAAAIVSFFRENRQEEFTQGIRRNKHRFSWDTLVVETEKLLAGL